VKTLEEELKLVNRAELLALIVAAAVCAFSALFLIYAAVTM